MVRPSSRQHQRMATHDVIESLKDFKKRHPEETEWADGMIAHWKEQIKNRKRNGEYAGHKNS